jgi:zinc transport system substrate-binding protein
MASRAAARAVLVAAGLAVFSPTAAGSAELRAVATIAPVHSLLAAVMDGVGVPTLLVRSGSPHDYALRPSDARALAAADLVVRVGPTLETFLDKPLRTLAGDAAVLDLIDAPGLVFHEVGEDHEAEHDGAEDHGAEDHEAEHHEGEDHEADDHGHGHAHEGADPHVWLDPANARVMAAAMAAALTARDPENAGAYRANGAALDARIEALQGELDAVLEPVRNRPFVTFHDAYGDFTKRFGLAFAGAVTVDPSRMPGAARLTGLRARLRGGDVGCVFAEPQFRPEIVDVVVEGTDARTGVLDPLGADVRPGPGHYFELMRRHAADLAACLDPDA